MSMFATLALSLALFCSPCTSPCAGAATLTAAPGIRFEDKYADAQAQFVRVAASGKLEERRAALEVLVALGDGRAMGPLVAEFSRVAQDLQASRSAARDAQYAFERRTVMLANLRELVGRDPSRESLIPREEERLQKVREERDAAVRRRDQLEPWIDALSAGMVKLVSGLGPAARRKAEEQAYQDAEEHPDAGVQAAAIDLIGRLGGPGATLRVLDRIERSHVERAKLESRLSKGAADVRKMERRLQEEAAANEGRTARASNDQYDQVRRESAQVRASLTALDAMIEVAVRAAGAALSQESGKDLEKSLAKLFGAIAKSKAGARLSVLRVLAFAPGEQVRARVRELVATEKDPAAIAVLLDGVSALDDKSMEPLVISRCLAHENWLVRSSAAATLARLRSRAAIEPMIDRLEKDEGRTRSDIGQALTSLTGQDFHGNVALWRRWWKDNGADFVVTPAPPEKSFVEEAQEQRGVTFFGISTDSQRVLFVLDLSGSMNFSMTPKNNPDDEAGREPDLPGKGESSRLDAAKRDLVKAIGGLRDGASFNLVLFASDVWTWADELIVMAPDKRAQLTAFIEASDAVGGTNIYGALERALDLAGAVGGDTFVDPAIDTIYLLTDGKASVGTTTDREEILSFVRARNQSAHITIHTIGLSDAHDAVLLRRLAEENHGRYVGR